MTSVTVNHLQISQRLAVWFRVAVCRAKALASYLGLSPVTPCAAFLSSKGFLWSYASSSLNCGREVIISLHGRTWDLHPCSTPFPREMLGAGTPLLPIHHGSDDSFYPLAELKPWYLLIDPQRQSATLAFVAIWSVDLLGTRRMSLQKSWGSLHVRKPQALFSLLHRVRKERARQLTIS